MGKSNKHKEVFYTSHVILLVSYTILSAILMVETLIMSWETWVIPMILTSLIACWYLHITQKIPSEYRMWLYVIVMMAAFFFYGIHEASTFDMAPVMMMAIALLCLTGKIKVIIISQIVYYTIMAYNLTKMVRGGYEFTTLVTTRIILHLTLIFIIGWIARNIIKKWVKILHMSDDDINRMTDATARMDDFLTNASHEMRTPVNAVIGLTTMMLKKEMSPEFRKDLNSVQEAGYRVSNQISDILDYTEIDMDKLAVNNETYMISSLINDLMYSINVVKPPELELVVDVDASVPSALSGDSVKIKKILWHIIINGLKYTKEGGVYVRIGSIEHTYGINLVIEISDTGIGMTESEIDKIADRFYQSNPGRTRNSGGLGIGMSIVQGFVKAMGGFMTITSEPDKGTTVTLSLPQIVVDHTGCMSIENSRQLCVAGFFHFDKFDNPQVREYYNKMISDLAKGLNVPFFKADDVNSLKKIGRNYRLTHIFVGEEEYTSARDYMESLASQVIVAVIADDNFVPSAGSGVKIIKKPFYCFPVVAILNMDINKANEINVNEQMYCPDLKALVVDDEPMNLLVAEGIFSNYGMIVTTANSGREAIKLCQANHYDVIFMDHMMPEMDGIEAMKRIKSVIKRKEDSGNCAIIALTANAVSSAKEMFLAEGFDGFVPIPIELSELERVLKNVLPKSAIVYREAGQPDRMLQGKEKDDNETKKTGKKKTGKKATQNNKTDNIISDKENKMDYTEEDGYASIDAELEALEKSGINTTNGLKYCQNDREFYKVILFEYGQDSENKLENMKHLYENKEWEDYAIKVHAIKSTSKMIGADKLSDIAKLLEDASKEKNEADIEKYHDDMMSRYSVILDVICDTYDLKNKPEEGSGNSLFDSFLAGEYDD